MVDGGELFTTTNDILGWNVTCFPILLVMLSVNVVWLFVNLWKRNGAALSVWFLIVILWLCWLSFEHFVRLQAKVL